MIDRSSSILLSLSVPLQSSVAGAAFATIPDKLFSYSTLLHVGFSESKAADIWRRWNNCSPGPVIREIDPDDSGLVMTFFSFMTGGISRNPDTISDDNQQWRDAMSTWGIGDDLQDAILDPDFRAIRLTESCRYWIKDTLHMRYSGLEEIQTTSALRELHLIQQLPSSTITPSPETATASGFVFDIDSTGSQEAITTRQSTDNIVLYQHLDSARAYQLSQSQGLP